MHTFSALKKFLHTWRSSCTRSWLWRSFPLHKRSRLQYLDRHYRKALFRSSPPLPTKVDTDIIQMIKIYTTSSFVYWWQWRSENMANPSQHIGSLFIAINLIRKLMTWVARILKSTTAPLDSDTVSIHARRQSVTLWRVRDSWLDSSRVQSYWLETCRLTLLH